MANRAPPLEIRASPHFPSWLAESGASLAFTTYQTNRLFLVGVKADGRLSLFERRFDRPMGLFATPERLWMSTRWQLWQLANALPPGERYEGFDRLYVPRRADTTGALDVHDIAVDADGRVVFVNTAYSCLATLSERYSFAPLWQPPFISRLAPEDRCHLNGLALAQGRPAYVTAVSRSDVAAGWRERRHEGGCLVDVATGEIVLGDLSMPHSPRVAGERLWLLNSGTGELGFVDRARGRFEPVAFCPGFLRGLAFLGDQAVVGLSKPRQDRTFSGLALDARLREKDAEARCGLWVIDVRSGVVVHWLELEGVVAELYDVAVLPGVRRPTALGFKSDEIQRLLTIDTGARAVFQPLVARRSESAEAPPAEAATRESDDEPPARRVTRRAVGATHSGMSYDVRSAARQLLREARAELAQLRRIRGAHRWTARRIGRAQRRLAFAAALLAATLAQPAAAAAPRFDNGAFGLANVGASAVARFGDLDGDGDLDALVGDGSGALRWFENTSTGAQPAFAAPLLNPFGLADVGLNASSALVDIDGDGDLDVFVGERYAGIFFFRNTGSASAPSFAAPIANPFGLTDVGTRSAPAFGDLDGDGDLDLLVGELSGSHFFFRNTGNASAPAFAPAQLNAFGLVDAGARSVPTLGDLDGDGDLDLLTGDLYGSTVFFENTGSAAAPAFAGPVADAFGLEPVASSAAPALVDVEGDGDLDAFVGEFYGAAIFFQNGGSAAAPDFAPTVRNPFGFASIGYATPVGPAFADIDGDGDLDAFVGMPSGEVLFFRNTGSAAAPSLAAPVANAFGLTDVGFYAVPTFADLDGDGDLDAAVGSRAGHTLWFRNTGTPAAPAFAAPLTNPFGLADVGVSASPSLADVDGDGDLDALIGNQDGNSLFFRNDGTAAAPAFAAPQTNPFGLADVGVHAAPALADLDRDGDLDALIGERNGGTLRFTNTGTLAAPAFAPPVANADGLLSVLSFTAPALADLDGDGDLDASLGGYLGRVFYFENRELDVDACRNGLDDDGDGRTDHPADAGCANPSDTSERSVLQCDNGLDDDHDGLVDWRADGSGDPHCASLSDTSEAATPPPACGLGSELLAALPLLRLARRRKATR